MKKQTNNKSFLTKQAAVVEIIRLEFVFYSDVSFCKGFSAAAASRC